MKREILWQFFLQIRHTLGKVQSNCAPYAVLIASFVQNGAKCVGSALWDYLVKVNRGWGATPKRETIQQFVIQTKRTLEKGRLYSAPFVAWTASIVQNSINRARTTLWDCLVKVNGGSAAPIAPRLLTLIFWMLSTVLIMTFDDSSMDLAVAGFFCALTLFLILLFSYPFNMPITAMYFSLLFLGITTCTVHIVRGMPMTGFYSLTGGTCSVVIPPYVIAKGKDQDITEATVLGFVETDNGTIRAFSSPRRAFRGKCLPYAGDILTVSLDQGKAVYEWHTSPSTPPTLTSVWDWPLRILALVVCALWFVTPKRVQVFCNAFHKSGTDPAATTVQSLRALIVIGGTAAFLVGLWLELWLGTKSTPPVRSGLPCGIYSALNEDTHVAFFIVQESDKYTSYCLPRTHTEGIPSINSKVSWTVQKDRSYSFAFSPPTKLSIADIMGTTFTTDEDEWNMIEVDKPVVDPKSYAVPPPVLRRRHILGPRLGPVLPPVPPEEMIPTKTD